MKKIKLQAISVLIITTLSTTIMPSFNVMAAVQPTKSVTAKQQAKKSIKSISNIRISIYQREKYTLPTKIAATMSDNSTQQVSVIWNTKKIDTSKVSNYTFIGTVQGYNQKVTLTLNVKDNSIVNFSDLNLAQKVRTILNNSAGNIYKSDVAK